MNERSTPLTDAAEYDNFNGAKVTPYVDADFARRLERQRDDAVEALRKATTELSIVRGQRDEAISLAKGLASLASGFKKLSLF